ncbi:hypothetical protein BGX34_010787 [Mortierella sp. NVP85]|nr:hypothetical protein BGX34_010787 [Mortierella sp. NVP85]
MGGKLSKPKEPKNGEKPWFWEDELSETEKIVLEKIRKRATFYDTGIDLGFTKVGIDPIVGLVPVLGDFITSALALELVFTAGKVVDKSITRKMYLNVIADTAIGFIPIVGDIGDFAFKCNDRNRTMFEKELKKVATARRDQREKDKAAKNAAYKIPPPPPIPASAGGGSVSRV